MTYFALLFLLIAAVLGVCWYQERQRLRMIQAQGTKSLAEKDEAERRMQRHADMLRGLVDAIDDGLFIVGQDMRVLFVNRGWLRFFPPASDPEGRTLLECVKDHRIVELVAGSRQSGQRSRQEFLVSAHGAGSMVEDRVYSVEAVPLHDASPPDIDDAVLVIIRDETGKHALEKIRKDFVANASHELRTPLSIINGYLENLIDGDIMDVAQSMRAFTIMKKHGDRLANIVEDLLVISRMESGHHDAVKQEDFDFHACAQDVIHRLTPVIQEKGAQVRVLMDENASPQICGDRFYWDQILFNLVSNALKENLARGLEVTIRLKQEQEVSDIQVRDNGVGIPHADLPFVFKRFYRVVRQHHAHEVKGTGLGLSIVKRAVEAHHGTISVHSKPGVETVFTIRVPRRPS